jgi:hypothetical protein
MAATATERADHITEMLLAWHRATTEPDGPDGERDPGRFDYAYRVRYLHHRMVHHRPRTHQRVGLMINGEVFELHPNARILIMENFTLNVGHTLDLVIVFLDTNGNPMLTQPTLDAPAQWTDAPSGSGVDTLTAAPDTLSAAVAALGPGTDTVSVALSVGGKPFAASAGVTVTAAPQVLGSIQLQGTVS